MLLTSSLNIGELSNIMPVSHPFIGSIRGALHSKEYTVFDEEMTYIHPAQMMAMTIIDLLFDEAQGAETLLENYKPLMTKQELLDFLDSFNR